MRSALRQILSDLGLAHSIGNDVLLIIPWLTAENEASTWIYPVNDILASDRSGPSDNLDVLVDLLRIMGRCATWDRFVNGGFDAGGSFVGTRAVPSNWGVSLGKARLLVFAETQAVHEQVAAVLEGLREAKAAATGRNATAAVAVPKCTPGSGRSRRP